MLLVSGLHLDLLKSNMIEWHWYLCGHTGAPDQGSAPYIIGNVWSHGTPDQGSAPYIIDNVWSHGTPDQGSAHYIIDNVWSHGAPDQGSAPYIIDNVWSHGAPDQGSAPYIIDNVWSHRALYIIVIEVLVKFLTRWLKDTKQIKTFKMLQSYWVINLKTKREKYIPFPFPISQFYSKKKKVVYLSHNELTKILIHWVLEIYGYICVRYYKRQIFIHMEA